MRFPSMYLLLALLPALAGCYFAKLAGLQLGLINRQRQLAPALRDEPDAERRRLLALVPELRAFARNVMQLRPGKNYTGYYATEQKGIVFILSASAKTRLEPYTFWFPVVGSVPYKSFVDEADAEEQERELQGAGYDTWLGRAKAYSTLGFFRDPITTVMMRKGTVRFVEVLLHEMAHARHYVPGQTEWNEQLASLVGIEGTNHFLRSHYGHDPALIAELEQHVERTRVREAAVERTLALAERLYASGKPDAVVLREREPLFERLRAELVALDPEQDHSELVVNNARLLQYKRYLAGGDRVTALWTDARGSWVRFWQLAEAHAESLD